MIVCGNFAGPAWAALNGSVQEEGFYENPQTAKVLSPKQILYQVTSKGLEEMKDALVKINLHMRENADEKRPKIMVAIYGQGINLLHKKSIDPELQYMLDWFYEEKVVVGVSKLWLEELKMVPDDLADGLAVLESLQSNK